MALTRVGHLSSATLLQLYRLLGSATAIVDHRNHIEDVVPGASPKLRECLSDIDAALRRAEEELAYDQRYAIQAITFADDDYPQRLRECDDAPLVLYYRGSVSLNAHRVICIVGTRKMYGVRAGSRSETHRGPARVLSRHAHCERTGLWC